MKLELTLALRYSFTKQKEAFLSIINIFSIIGIALGVATLIIVMSVMNGYEKSLFTKILGFKGHLLITTLDRKVLNWRELSEELKLVLPEVKLVAPVIEKEALAMTNNATNGIIFKALDLTSLDKKMTLSDGILVAANNCSGLFIGKDLADNLQVNPYDTIKIIIPEINQTMIGMIPRIKSYSVCGTFDLGFTDYNTGLIFHSSIEEAQKLFKLGEAVTGLEISLSKIEDAQKIKGKIIEILRHNNFQNENLAVVDWQEMNKSLTEGLKLERTVMFFILSLIIVIAVFNIISSLILLVKDKSKEIAILRTLGITRLAIMRVFIMAGLILGVIGTGLGILIGVIISLNLEKIRLFLEQFTGVTLFDPVIYFLTKLPCDLNYSELVWIGLLSIFSSFLATLYPAWRVATLPPAAILRQG